MESNWGRNVFDYGLANLGITLAARSTSFPDTVYTNREFTSGGFAIWDVPLPDTDIPYVGRVQAKMPGHPHFPYGWDVEPVVNL